jgi:glycosyltransferase involved in cell wall biosynthesis
MPPRFSVIVPVYNRGALLRPTIDSILGQEFQDFELIAVDDGSTDDSVSVMEAYGPRVKVLRKKNGGPGSARNAGMRQARGDYLAFLDSDDLWPPWTLSIYQRVIEQFGRPSFIVGNRMFFTDLDQIPTPPLRSLEARAYDNFFHAMRGGIGTVIPSGVALRRDALAAGDEFSDMMICEDIDLFIRLGLAPGFVMITHPVTFLYRIHAGSISRSTPHFHAGVLDMLSRERRNFYPGGDTFKGIRRDRIAFQARAAAVQCSNSGHYRKSLELYFKTFLWQAQLRRFRFLLGFPPQLAKNLMMHFLTGKPHDQ